MYDVLVIGAGPGGYVAALRAAQLGLRVVCVDAWCGDDGKSSPGGTCLNVGCIPSKALLESSAFYQRVTHEARQHGIRLAEVGLDLGVMQQRKQRIVRQLTHGVRALFDKNGVTFVHGRASLSQRDDEGFGVIVQVLSPEIRQQVLRARQVIVASGSVPRSLPKAPWLPGRIMDSQGALELEQVPARLGIIGAGVIGLELGSVWQRLGSQVTLLESQSELLPAADRDLAQEAQRSLSRHSGLTLQLGVMLESVTALDGGVVEVRYQAAGQTQVLNVEVLIVAVGRDPCTAGLGLERVGVTLDERGAIPVDGDCRTAVPGLWAIGDVVRGPMLAHKAEEEGVAVAERLAGQKPAVDLGHIPSVIYTEPEMAWVGLTEAAAQQSGRPVRVGRFPFTANGRAKARGMAQGWVKVIACTQTDRLLGIHIVGPEASELIAEAVVALEFKASSEDIARIPHAHPSLGEAFREACLGVDGRSLNV